RIDLLYLLVILSLPPRSTLFPYTTLFRSKDNLTILDLARKIASAARRSPIPLGSTARSAWANSERQKLNSVVRCKQVRLARIWTDRKSTRLNSSHGSISYAVFCLKKKHNT